MLAPNPICDEDSLVEFPPVIPKHEVNPWVRRVGVSLCLIDFCFIFYTTHQSSKRQFNILACYSCLAFFEWCGLYAAKIELLFRYQQLGLIDLLFFLDTALVLLFSLPLSKFEEMNDFYDWAGLSCGIILIYCQSCIFLRYLYVDTEFTWTASRYFVTFPATIIMTFKANLFPLIPFTPLFIHYGPTSPNMKKAIFIIFAVMFLYSILTLRENMKWPSGLEAIHIKTYFTDEEVQQAKGVTKRRRSKRAPTDSDFHLRICQITDPHLGDFCSMERLRRLCELIVEEDPDLVFLTGDFFTPAGLRPQVLQMSLQPLAEISERCFACYGNHDLEEGAEDICTQDLEELGIRILKDEFENITQVASDGCSYGFQIVGFNWQWATPSHRQEIKNRILHMASTPGTGDMYRLILNHRPEFLKSEIPSTTFSGHTHGGMIFWVKCLADRFNLMVAGLFQRGDNLLYVNRGQGSRSLGLNLLSRMNVSLEYSVYHLHFQKKTFNKARDTLAETLV